MLYNITLALFNQIENSLASITNEDYITPNKLLHNATLGQHLRHIIELFQEMLNGLESGSINYEDRKRNYAIESNKQFAIQCLTELISTLPKENKTAALITDYCRQYNDLIIVSTNYYREWIYNIEHTIHHMALMRIALENNFNVIVPTEYGVAPSTTKYKLTCAQ